MRDCVQTPGGAVHLEPADPRQHERDGGGARDEHTADAPRQNPPSRPPARSLRGSLRAGRHRAGDAEQREGRRTEPRVLPEPIRRAVHHPVREAGQRGGRHGRSERPAAPHRAHPGEQRREEPGERQQRTDDPRLGERAQLHAVRIARRLPAVPATEVFLREVVDARAQQRMRGEFVEGHAVEVVAVGSEPGDQAVAGGVGFIAAWALERVPRVLHARHRVAGRREPGADAHDHHDRRERSRAAAGRRGADPAEKEPLRS